LSLPFAATTTSSKIESTFKKATHTRIAVLERRCMAKFLNVEAGKTTPAVLFQS